MILGTKQAQSTDETRIKEIGDCYKGFYAIQFENAVETEDHNCSGNPKFSSLTGLEKWHRDQMSDKRLGCQGRWGWIMKDSTSHTKKGRFYLEGAGRPLKDLKQGSI